MSGTTDGVRNKRKISIHQKKCKIIPLHLFTGACSGCGDQSVGLEFRGLFSSRCVKGSAGAMCFSEWSHTPASSGLLEYPALVTSSSVPVYL